MGWVINERTLSPTYVDEPREACWFGDGYEDEDEREFDWFVWTDDEGTETVLCHVECGERDARLVRMFRTHEEVG